MNRFVRLFPVAAFALTVACGQTDSGITTAVKSKLAADDTVKAYQVDVDTRDHVVTLSGTVDSIVAKEQAVRIARESDGVRDVIDNLQLKETAATSGVGTDINTASDAAEVKTREGADSVSDAAKDAGRAAKKGAKSVAEGAKKVGSDVSDGAKKVGSDIKDTVTDKDRDSDKDGK
ncbi:MAG TPA: BON domain-containing protein [Vicinamibacterales bacterium]|nr:BON domain-containing protein [Vicinamibacterales bacterium]